MFEVCRCNVPMAQGCSSCGGAIPQSAYVGTAKVMREIADLKSSLAEIASLAGSPSSDFGGSHDEQRAAIFNACADARAGKKVLAANYRSTR